MHNIDNICLLRRSLTNNIVVLICDLYNSRLTFTLRKGHINHDLLLPLNSSDGHLLKPRGLSNQFSKLNYRVIGVEIELFELHILESFLAWSQSKGRHNSSSTLAVEVIFA